MKRFYVLLLMAIFPALLFSESTQEKNENSKGVAEVSPTEDLMREHGILNRILLIYEEIISRLDNGTSVSPDLLKDSAGIIHKFIENYHEKLEEDYVFARFEKEGKMLDLIKVLKEQHQKGRILTDYILKHAMQSDINNRDIRKRIKEYMEEFITMYRPHEAREDTVLFPEFKKLISQKEYDELGDIFEKIEQELFGENGFEKMVEKVAAIEKALGIYNLSKFTPKQ